MMPLSLILVEAIIDDITVVDVLNFQKIIYNQRWVLWETAKFSKF